MTASSGVFARHAGYIVFDCPDCGVNGQEAEVTEDREAGTWSFSCGTEGCPFEDHHDINDVGATEALFVIRMTGWALILMAVLGHSAWSWPLIIGGLWLLVVVHIVALFMGAKQQEGNRS